ncbi:MAG: radical SAM protein [Thermodesulfobacteriota bacterium]
MLETVCHFPWTTIYLEPNGDAFPCCHRQPFRLGNIYCNTALEILKGREATTVRLQAGRSELACFQRCTRAPSRRCYNAGRRPYPVSPQVRLEELHVNISTRCNLKCVMCGQDHRARETLNPALLTAAVDWTGSPRLIIQGGEPLVVPEAYELAAWVKRNSASPITLITNATALDQRWEEVLLNGSNEVRVSLNAATRPVHEAVNRGSSWAKVMRNLHRLARLRQQNKGALYLTLRMTVVPANVAEMPSFIGFGQAEGYADRITFGFDKKTMPRWIKANKKVFLGLYEAFLAEATRSKVTCDAWRLFQLARDLGLENRELKFGRKGQLLGGGGL